METVFINLCIHPIDFSDKELTMCSFLSLVFWLPCIPSVYWQFHCGCSFWQATLQSYNIGFFFCTYTNFTFFWASWDKFPSGASLLRSEKLYNMQFLFNILIWVSGGIWSLFLQDFGTMCNWGVRTLHLWLQRKWEEPVCQSGPIARVRMKVWV